MSMMRPIGGFESLRSDVGGALGDASAARYKAGAEMAKAAERARTRIWNARQQADAQLYAGEQAGNAAQFQGIASAVGSIGGSLIGGLGKLNTSQGSSGSSGTAWGMPDATSGYSWGSGDWTQYATDSNQYFNPGSWKPDQTNWSINRTGW